MEIVEQLRFESWTPIEKAVEDSNGEWLMSGPVASHQKDFDGETIEKAGVIEGLDMHQQLGGQVDWDHMWARTHDPDVIIGKAIDRPVVDLIPWLVTKLRKSLPLAQKAWRLKNDPDVDMRIGYSIQGGCIRHPDERSRIIKCLITMVTLAPQPKGFDQFVIAGRPVPSLNQIAKAVMGQDDLDTILGFWEPFELTKALTTGAGIVQPGDIGGRTLRSQELLGNIDTTSYGQGRRLKPDVTNAGKSRRKRMFIDDLLSKGFSRPDADRIYAAYL